MILPFHYHHCVAQADFPDAALGECVLEEGLPIHKEPMILLGRKHSEMILDPSTVRMLLPYLQHFARTGRITDPPRPDWSI